VLLNNWTDIFRVAFLLWLLPLSALACADAEQGLIKLGEGKLRWFGFPIYTASLWSEPGASLQDIYSQPMLLELDYDRDVSNQQILKSTREEWKRVNMEYPERAADWLASLASILPDISAGERLSSRVTPAGETCFYLDGQAIGRVNDARFGPAFLSIWLDSQTRSRSLRTKLLGGLLVPQAD